jgi:hypothetical protein
VTAIAFTDDSDGPDTYATMGEAVAAAIAASEDGEEVIVHSPLCVSGEIDDAGEYRACNCAPEIIDVRKGEVI